ncbi:hypothetical protein O7599_12825 [Streptomyces sp. WMMC500]|uniref:hypothetical protein n=1 Tax=Streptomyces sp. WMMC500 TaxID=3015154 RepID=UPI00248A92DE|nr:hypothetical protein [Streptomyces sp. WMMC500]WBB63351.1 hypothetical protein O7599_12825 [Streptomyces sp. WMMC500]
MELRERLADVRRRPRAYGLSTLGEVVAFLTGVDAATDWRFLEGFREWLAAKSNLGANLALPVLLVRIAYPDKGTDFWLTATREESAKAVAVLFDELESFLESPHQ